MLLGENPGTRGGSGFRDQTLAVKSRKTKFQPQEFPRSGSKAEDVKEERKSESQ